MTVPITPAPAVAQLVEEHTAPAGRAGPLRVTREGCNKNSCTSLPQLYRIALTADRVELPLPSACLPPQRSVPLARRPRCSPASRIPDAILNDVHVTRRAALGERKPVRAAARGSAAPPANLPASLPRRPPHAWARSVEFPARSTDGASWGRVQGRLSQFDAIAAKFRKSLVQTSSRQDALLSRRGIVPGTECCVRLGRRT